MLGAFNRWPHTLFGRLAVLMLIVVAGSQALSYTIMDRYRDRISAEQLARLVDAHVHAAAVLIAALPADQAQARFSDTPDVTPFPNAGRARLQSNILSRPALFEPRRDFLRDVAERLRARMAPQYDPRLFVSRAPLRALWVSFHVAGKTWWLTLPRVPTTNEMSWRWMSLLALALVLAVAATAWISWHTTSPLTALIQALRDLGAGQQPKPLIPKGPDDIRSLTHEFNRMLGNLDALEAERRELLAGVSHDLRAPLTRMRLRSEFIEQTPDKEAWLRDVQSLENIVSQFLSFVRQEEGEQPIKVSLQSVVAPLIQHYQQLGQNIELQGTDAPPLWLRPQALERLLVNLIDNAIEYGAPPIIVTLQFSQGIQTLLVRDHGPGIAPEAIAHALSPYVRLAADRGGAGHCGLGLAIVARIARLLEAELKLSNAEGKGLRVSLSWPAQIAATLGQRPPYFSGRRALQANHGSSNHNPD